MSQLLLRPIISSLLCISKKDKLIRNIDISMTILLTIITYLELNK